MSKLLFYHARLYVPLLSSIFLHLSVFSIFYKSNRPVLQLQSKRIFAKVKILPARSVITQPISQAKTSVSKSLKKNAIPKLSNKEEDPFISPEQQIPVVETPPEPISELDQFDNTSLSVQPTTGPGSGSDSASHSNSEVTQSDANWSNVPLSQLMPKFPYNAQVKGVEGWVIIMFDINEEGRPTNIQIVDSVPKGFFEHEAKKSIRSRRYKPYLNSGIPSVKSGVRVKVEFTLND